MTTTNLLPFDALTLYSRDDCPWCDKARQLLSEKGIGIEQEIKVGREITPAQFKVLASDYNWTPPTVPMIFYRNEKLGNWILLGGFIELEEMLKNYIPYDNKNESDTSR